MESLTTIDAVEAMKRRPDRLRRILFVCLGNICRSPAAEGVMRAIVEENEGRGAAVENEWEIDRPGARTRFVIDSAGTGDYHIGDLPDRRMRAHAARRGYDLTHRCRQISMSDFFDFDLIIGMDESNLRNLRRLAPTVEAEQKIMPAFFDDTRHYDYVPDPYYEGADGFELVLDLLQAATRNLYAAITARPA